METEKIGLIKEWILELFTNLSIPPTYVDPTVWVIKIVIVVVLTILLDKISKNILLAVINKLVVKSKVKWDDVFMEHKVFTNFAHLIPVIALDYLMKLFFSDLPNIIQFVDKLSDLALVWVFLLILSSLTTSLTDLSKGNKQYVSIAILSLSQLVRTILFVFAVVVSLSIILNIDLGSIFGAMGALMAVIILVFRDTILGFVASVQLSTSKAVKIGDWVVLPEYKADGYLTELNLMTSKIKNWDKTETSVPTYALISSGVKNWDGMIQTGARRIKRSIHFDVKSIHFLQASEIEKFKGYILLKDFIEEKEKAIGQYNSGLKENSDVIVNQRRQTNIGLFRKYCELYLQNNENISSSQTLMVRQLQANEFGIPLEVYCFTNDTRWVNYEGIQADIFDHLYATASEFGLRIFQNPSGYDVLSLKGK